MDGEALDLGLRKKIKKKDYAISESIFPEQNYRAAIFFKHKHFFTESEEVIKDLKNNNLNLNNLNLKFSKLVTKSKISKRATEEEIHICKELFLTDKLCIKLKNDQNMLKNNKSKKKSLIIIPARGGSKGIARKNIRPLAGYPFNLLFYTGI